jgi:hypothetical protein
MAFPKHCVSTVTVSSRQGADRSDCRADRHRQPADTRPVNAAKRRDRQPRGSGHACPAGRAKSGDPGMAGRGKNRREEGEGGSRSPGASQVRWPVGRTGDQTMAAPHRARPAAGADMNSGSKRRRQPDIAGHHKDETARPADAREVPPQRLAAWLAIMAQDHAGQAARQPRRRRPRIRQPARVGEQPKLRQAAAGAAPGGGRPRPGK